MNENDQINPSVILWSEILSKTLFTRAREHRREPDYSLELIAAIEETNQRILKEQNEAVVG